MKRPFSLFISSLLAISFMAPGLAFAADETTVSIEEDAALNDEVACHEEYDPALKTAIRADFNAYQTALIKEWQRQVGFRIRAATTASSKRLRQSTLNRSERTLAGVLGQLKTSADTLTANDIPLLDEALTADDASEESILAWTKKKPSFTALDRTLDQLQRDLLRYANSTDQRIIIRVWAEKRQAFRDDLVQQMMEARQTFSENIQDCYGGASDESTQEEDAAPAGHANETVPATPATVRAPANPVRTSAPERREEPAPATPPPSTPAPSTTPTYTLSVNSVYIKVASESGELEGTTCTERTVAHAYIYANGRAQITGFFALQDGSRYPNVSFPTDDSGFVYARQILDYGTGAVAANAGAVKFVVVSPSPAESSYAPFVRTCANQSTDRATVRQEPAREQSTVNTESSGTAPASSSANVPAFDLLSVHIKLLSQMRSDDSCAEHLTAHAYISANRAETVSGYFILESGTRLPVVNVDLDSSGFGEVQKNFDNVASPQGGTIKFVLTSPTIKETMAAIYKPLCTATTGATTANSSPSSAATGSATASGTTN